MKLNKYIVESSLSRIVTHIEKTPQFGVISPFRKENSDQENEENYKELAKKIRGLGYGHIQLQGGYTGDEGFFAEKSYFIPNIKRGEIVELGIEYDQHSIIHKDRHDFALIGTNKQAGIGKALDKFIVDKKGINLETVAVKFKDFFSSLAKGGHRGKKFLFKMQEKAETSMYYEKKHGATWITIFSD